MQSITILGSTGSIGQSTLDIIARHPDQFRVEALTAHKNVALLFRQCQQFKPRFAAISDATLAQALQIKLKEKQINTEVVLGSDAIIQLAADTASETVVAAIVGAVGLLPTLSAISAGKKVLLANKEALVMAADLLMQAIKKSHATLLPIDSEHNAIFQCLPAGFLPGLTPLNDVHSIILTASGGPFRTTPLAELKNKTPMQAIAHPNWKMGAKISIDSATMMNKGLEVIEACWLFGLSIEQIQVLIHPQSIIHSLVSFERFPCLRLAFQALKTGGTATAILNAANEVAVDAFYHNQIRFDQIATMVDAVLQKSNITCVASLNDILDSDKKARELTTQLIKESVYSCQ